MCGHPYLRWLEGLKTGRPRRDLEISRDVTQNGALFVTSIFKSTNCNDMKEIYFIIKTHMQAFTTPYKNHKIYWVQ